MYPAQAPSRSRHAVALRLSAVVILSACTVGARPALGADASESPTAAERQGTPSAPSEKLAAVIPAGQDQLISEMIALGKDLPGGCKLTDAAADKSVIRATYGCPDGEVVFEFAHPDYAAASARKTGQFAIAIQKGTPPAGLWEALIEAVRAKEGEFRWERPTPYQPPTLASPSQAPEVKGTYGWGAVLVLVVLGVAVLWWRRR